MGPTLTYRRSIAARYTVFALMITCWGATMRPATAQPPVDAPPAVAAAASAEEEAAYTRTISERADKIVATLGISDAEMATRVRDLVIQQYRSLRELHAARDAKIAEATKTPGADPTVLNAWVGVTKAHANLKLLQLHRRFVARLAVELTPDQVVQMKDGLTYGDVQITHDRYLQMLPKLTGEQQREILANLIEVREYAMDADSVDEKHAIFGQYTGKINNYLSAAGYDLKQAEKDLAARETAKGQQESQ